jgi:hypothetical protein
LPLLRDRCQATCERGHGRLAIRQDAAGEISKGRVADEAKRACHLFAPNWRRRP